MLVCHLMVEEVGHDQMLSCSRYETQLPSASIYAGWRRRFLKASSMKSLLQTNSMV